jgi:hypothetical protein
LVRETRQDLTRQLLGLDADPDESPENSYAAVRVIFAKHDFKAAVKQHRLFCSTRGAQGQHFQLCASFCLHHEVSGAEETLFAAFSSIWQLLGFGRQINSGWPIVLHCDASFNFCRSEVSLVTIGYSTLGCHYRNVVASINGGGRETRQSYEVTYNAMLSAFHIVCAMPTCDDVECKTCCLLEYTRTEPLMETHLKSDQAKVKELPVLAVTADSGKGVAAFAREVVGVPRFKCYNHITGNLLLLSDLH